MTAPVLLLPFLLPNLAAQGRTGGTDTRLGGHFRPKNTDETTRLEQAGVAEAEFGDRVRVVVSRVLAGANRPAGGATARGAAS
jgi:hypothetical protein